MVYKKWMTQVAFASDGAWTIGYVDGAAAKWDGIMHVLAEGEYYAEMPEGTIFTPAFQGPFIVKTGRWIKKSAVEKAAKASIIERIKTMEAPELRGKVHCADCYEDGYAAAIADVIKYLEERSNHELPRT